MDSPIAGRAQGVPLGLTSLMLVAGVAIAWIDTRPNWDDTGVTAGGILVAAGLGGLLGLRPWLAAVIVVGPLLIAEYRSAGVGLLVAPVVAFVGAYGAALGRHLLTGSTK